MRRHKPYAPCARHSVTGLPTLPTLTTYGDGLCDPGVAAYDLKVRRCRLNR